MPKVIIAQPCVIVPPGAAAQHADIGETHDLDKNDAHFLARLGRAFYLERDADPTKGALTATAEDKTRIKRLAAEAAAESAARARGAGGPLTPSQVETMIAEAVADAMAKSKAA